MPIKRAFLDLPHGQLHYRSNFRSDLPALVLLHQSPSDSRMYLGMMAELDTEFFLIAPDNPGFGQSDSLAAGFSLEACAAAIEALLQDLGVQRCHLFGHHTGASIAVQYASDYPAGIQTMVLCGPTLLSEQMRAILPGKAAPFPEQGDGSHLLGMWQRMQGKEGDTPLPLLMRETQAAFESGENYQAAYIAVTQQDFAAQLCAIQVPVLVCAGTRDILYPSLQGSYDLLQQGSMVEFEDAGGYVCDRQPELLAAQIRTHCL